MICILYCPMLHFQKYNATHTKSHSLLSRGAKEVGGGSYYDQQTSYYLLTSLLLHQGRWHYTSQLSVVSKRQKGICTLVTMWHHLTGSDLSKSIYRDCKRRLNSLQVWNFPGVITENLKIFEIFRTSVFCFFSVVFYTNQYLLFCWPFIILYQYSETNMMHFLFSLLRIKGLYIRSRRYTNDINPGAANWHNTHATYRLCSESWGWASNARNM
jgi:hypothetical protein